MTNRSHNPTPERTSELIAAWDAATAVGKVQRPVTLLAALRHESPDEIARWPLGQRELAFLEIQRQRFGSVLQCLGSCPACGADIEFNAPTPGVDQDARNDGPLENQIEQDGWTVRFRLLNSFDLWSAASTGSVEEARRSLVAAVCLEARNPAGNLVEAANLPIAAIERLAVELEAADPFADISFDMTCPDCRHTWEVTFDAGEYLWKKVEWTAAQLLEEVHLLASAYGWDESIILGLSPRRRRFYLDRIHE
jgi:hypothetical protein